MKRIMTVAALIVLMTSVLYGGGQKEAAGTMAKQVEFLWFIWDDPAAQGHNVIIDKFMKENPNVTVEISRTPWSKYEETVRARLAGGSPPDMIQVEDDFVQLYGHNQWLVLLDEVADGMDIRKEDTYERFWDFNFYKGHMVSVTPGVKVRMAAYNKKLLAEAGLAEPPSKWESRSWTWDTAVEYGKKLVKKEGGRPVQWGFAANHDAGNPGVWIDNNIPEYNDMYSGDGKEFVAATPAGVEAIQWLTDISYVHGIQPPWGVQQQGANVDNLFYSGKLGIELVGTWHIPPLRKLDGFDWDLAPMPMKLEGHTQVSLVCYGIPLHAKNPEVSKKLAAFLMSEETAKVFSSTGFCVPVVRQWASEHYVQPSKAPSRQSVITEGMEFGYAPVFTEYTGGARDLWTACYREAFSGERPVKDVIFSYKDEIEKIIQNK
jgi:multiple sugar transport system substrate-binding protein